MNTYEKQAQKFLKKTKTMLSIEYKECGSMLWDKKGEQRDIYEITLSNKNGSYTFDFGASLVDTDTNKKPTAYDILSCLDIIYSESFEDFCSEYGFSDDSISALNTYEACVEQSEALKDMFSEEELEMLQEIQ